MPTIELSQSVAVALTPRVQQLCGLFDVPPHKRSERSWTCHLPLEEREWQIGLIHGASGSGKSTLARQLWPEQINCEFSWPKDKSIVDAFPKTMGIKDITGLLSSVGFSSPPAWLRPFRCLSNGEQFRVTLARTLAEHQDLAVVDEFTSVVDRQVAQIGSAAIAQTVRRRGGQFVAVSCHADIIDWLEPDWTYNPQADEFHWRCERPGQPPRWQRPPLTIEIRPVRRSAWRWFHQHHYLSGNLSKASSCYVGFLGGTPAVFTAVLHFPHFAGSRWREHRTVCLPDFQGCGVGNAMATRIAAAYAATGKLYASTTSHPAMIFHRAKSPHWRMIRKPSMVSRPGGTSFQRAVNSVGRNTASFVYCGPADHDAARALGIIRGA